MLDQTEAHFWVTRYELKESILYLKSGENNTI